MSPCPFNLFTYLESDSAYIFMHSFIFTKKRYYLGPFDCDEVNNITARSEIDVYAIVYHVDFDSGEMGTRRDQKI